MRDLFRPLAQRTSEIMASPSAFLAAVIVILIWFGSGPFFHFSDTWQLIINTGSSIITFLMVFLLHRSQSRDTRAIQLKLDELLRSVKAARNELVSLENLSDEELDRLRREFAILAASSSQKPAPIS
jgi:low affinity Fe/Cu permease